jgi:16S rRNA (guanine527-N7)-methyltransferase
MDKDIGQLERYLPFASPILCQKFRDYFAMVEQYNIRINLIAKGTVPKAAVKHICDSYQGLDLIRNLLIKDQPIFDFGSGNGFPGIIAAMMFPGHGVILVERDQRKAEFLRMAAHQLKLDNVEVHAGGVGDLTDGSCQNVISRAMAPLPKFLLLARPVVAPGGSAFLFKSEHWSTEFSTVPAQVFDYWDVDLLSTYELPNGEGTRYLIRCLRQ